MSDSLTDTHDVSVEVPVDAGSCPGGQVLRYESPGCGVESKPLCGSPVQDACFQAVCSCRGATISRCDYAPEPFIAFGACTSNDSGLTDMVADAADSGIDTGNLPIDGSIDQGVDGTAFPRDSSVEVSIDRGQCPPGQVLRYESPGSGTEANPVCGSPVQDACFRAVCSCRGATISRCDYAPEPFASFGACPVPDGGAAPVDGAGTKDVRTDGTAANDLGGETASNPCAKCAVTEVCVQDFNGTCGWGTISCRTVSETCRTKLSASGLKNCTSIPECETEFCSSPLRCVYGPPCPNEAPEVALHCYGP